MRRIVVPLAIAACGGAGSAALDAAIGGDGVPRDGGDGDGEAPQRWQPHPGTSWQWQISDAIDTSVDAAVYDIDLFETPQATIDTLHAAGRKVICYFDTAYEPGRPDSAQLAPYRGSPIDGWPGQYWLDIRVQAVRDVMAARIALAQTKRCDGIEPDDVDVATNDTQLHITPAEQLDFIRFVIGAGHARALAVGLKNDLDQVGDLVGAADFAINEQCFEYTECDALAPFIRANKPVWNTEYTDGDLAAKGATVCPGANALNFDTLIKHLDLGAARYTCR